MLRKPPILVVKDEPHVSRFLNELLAEAGFDVRAVADGAAAIGELRNADQLAACIVDLEWPDLSGEDLAASIHAQWPELPLVIASGHDTTHCRDRFKADSNVSILAKPFDGSGLLNTIASLGVSHCRRA